VFILFNRERYRPSQYTNVPVRKQRKGALAREVFPARFETTTQLQQPPEMFRSVNTTGAQRSPFADLTFLPLFLSRKKVGQIFRCVCPVLIWQIRQI
ncbi:MAG: hypothetical protein QM610_02740, partial [Chitinophagaceae bacterium]